MSKAFDIDGTFGEGTDMSTLRPAFLAAFTVVFP